MEKLKFELQSAPLSAQQAAVICGVVGSGNLEVLVSQHDQADICQIEVTTSAVGFQHVWQSVLNEFAQRHAVAVAGSVLVPGSGCHHRHVRCTEAERAGDDEKEPGVQL